MVVVHRLVALFIVAAFLANVPTSVFAACTKTKICSLAKKGVETSDIADTCEMDEDEVEEIIATCKKSKPPVGSEKGGGTTPRQAVCCDGFGNSRCPIVAGSTQIGDACFCPGQGYGVICR